MDLYVGNLAFSVTEQDLEKTFSKFGKVDRVKLVTDRETGRSRGFGFVSMEEEAAKDAISGLNGSEMQKRVITVKESEKRENSPRKSYNNNFSRNSY